VILRLAVSAEHRLVSYGRTDKQTDRHTTTTNSLLALVSGARVKIDYNMQFQSKSWILYCFTESTVQTQQSFWCRRMQWYFHLSKVVIFVIVNDSTPVTWLRGVT